MFAVLVSDVSAHGSSDYGFGCLTNSYIYSLSVLVRPWFVLCIIIDKILSTSGFQGFEETKEYLLGGLSYESDGICLLPKHCPIKPLLTCPLLE